MIVTITPKDFVEFWAIVDATIVIWFDLQICSTLQGSKKIDNAQIEADKNINDM